jgi:acyl carrier protein
MHPQRTVLREIFASILGEPVDRIDAQASPETLLSWDSLRHVELIIEVENRYGVSFSTTEIFAMTSFQGFEDALARKGVDLGCQDEGARAAAG